MEHDRERVLAELKRALKPPITPQDYMILEYILKESSDLRDRKMIRDLVADLSLRKIVHDSFLMGDYFATRLTYQYVLWQILGQASFANALLETEWFLPKLKETFETEYATCATEDEENS